MRMAFRASMSIALAVVLAGNVRADESVQVARPSAACQETKVFTPVDPLRVASRTGEQFVVRCQVNRTSDDGSSQPLAVPTLVVTDGQEARLAVEGQRPFVTGMRTGPGYDRRPVVTTLAEGLSGNLTVTRLEGQRVQVDASITISAIDQVDTIPGELEGEVTQSPQQSLHGWRVVRSIELGESIEFATQLGCDRQPASVVLTVDRLSVEEAAITPIRLGDTKPAIEPNAEPTVAVMYDVGDLLQPYAQDKPPGELQATDLMPVIELLLSASGIAWSDDAAIRPVPEQRALIIQQTEAAHEQISQLLADQRDNVAAIKRLIK